MSEFDFDGVKLTIYLENDEQHTVDSVVIHGDSIADAVEKGKAWIASRGIKNFYTVLDEE